MKRKVDSQKNKQIEDRWLVVLNPNAGGKLAQKRWPSIKKELDKAGIFFKLFKTQKPLHAVKVVGQKIENGFRKIIVVGGDGTLHEVVNGIMQQKHVSLDQIMLGIISVGSGNDWIKTHKISDNYKEAIQQIKQGRTIDQDIGCVMYKNGSGKTEKRFFVNSVGIGFDARVVKYILPKKMQGKSHKADYVRGLVKSLFTHKNVNSLIQLDNKQINAKVFNLTIGICQYKGGGFKLLPNAIPNDGLLDVTLACKISKRKLIVVLPKIFGGKVETIKYFDFYQVQNMKIDVSRPIHIEADGEYLGFNPLQVMIAPGRLRLISAYTN